MQGTKDTGYMVEQFKHHVSSLGSREPLLGHTDLDHITILILSGSNRNLTRG